MVRRSKKAREEYQKRKDYFEKRYQEKIKPTREPEKAPRERYKCPLCGFYVWSIGKLLPQELNVLIQFSKGYKQISYEEGEITEEYREQVKKSCTALLKTLK